MEPPRPPEPNKEANPLTPLPPYQSHEATCKTEEDFSQKIIDYALKNPGSALSICILTFGGLLLLIYFFRIGFLPDIELESATTLLYATAILGLSVLVFFSSCFIAPAFLAKIMLESFKEQGQLTAGRALRFSGLAAFSFWILLTISVQYGHPFGWSLIISGIVVIIILLATSLYYSACPKVKDEKLQKLGRPKYCAALWVTGAAILQSILLAIVFLITFGLGRDGAFQKEDNWTLLIVLMPLLLSAFIPLLIQKTSWREAIRLMAAIGPVLLILVLLLTESFSYPSALVVARLGAGEFETTSLVLSGKGCKQFNLALGGEHCIEVKDDEPTTLCPVTLRSRIGGQILIEVSPMSLSQNETLVWVKRSGVNSEAPSRRRVVLDKSALLAWSSLLPLKTQSPSAPFTPLREASLVYTGARKALIAQGKQQFAPVLKDSAGQNEGDQEKKGEERLKKLLEERLLELCGRPN